MADRLGQQFGNYRLVSLLGQGGFAEVYLGQHLRLNQQAAIKVLHAHLTGTEAEHFQQEAQTIATLLHPSIIRVFDYNVQDGVPFLVMDYAPGGSLRRHFSRGNSIPLPQILSTIKQVADALQYAHDQKVVHRDVKPENILLGRREEVLLSDFGLAALVHSSASLSTQDAVGTLVYMAPELIEGHPRLASDQYALGIVVYEWLCGNRPFEGSPTEVIVQQLTMPPPLLHERVPTIPLELEQVVLRALAKDPRQRFASIQDFATALQHADQGSISTPHVFPLPSVSRAQPASPYFSVPIFGEQEQPFSASHAAPSKPPSTELVREGLSEALLPELMVRVPSQLIPLVGRRVEWAQLQSVWQSASAGHPHLLVLSGEAGIGKTRLAEELFVWVAQQGHSTARAACYAVEGELAYAPVSLWLRAEDIHSCLSSLPALWLSEVARIFPQLLVEHPDLLPPGSLTESWQRQRLFEALARAILAARQPLLLLLDDLQWCDQETLAWLHYLLRFDHTVLLLIVGTLRAEELTDENHLHSWLASLRHEGHLTQLTLEGLSVAETATLASQLAGHDLDSDAAIRLYQETEGNALFVVETMRMAHEQVEAIDGYAATTPGGPLRVARMLPTIQAVITERLAKLSPVARELATLAAVIGRAFSFELLIQVSKREEDELLEALDELWQRRILREAQGECYDFSHAKLCEVAYNELQSPRRRLLHRRVAEALERVYANNLDSVYGQIALHYEQAGVVERAIAFYQRAAEVAERVYAHTEALIAYRRALTLLKAAPSREDQQEKLAQLHERVGEVLFLTGQYDEAKLAYESALSHMPNHDCIWQAHLHRESGEIFSAQHRYTEALQAYSTAEAVLGLESATLATEWFQEWIAIQSDRIDIHYWLGQVGEMTELVEKTRPILEQYGTPTQSARFFLNLALMSSRRDRYVMSEEILGYARSALSASQEAGDVIQIALVQFNVGFLYLWDGDLDEAEEQMQAALAMAERTGDVILQSRCLTYLTTLYRKRGQVKGTKDYASHALTIATAMNMLEYIAMAKANLAWVAWQAGLPDEVEFLGRTALELWHQPPTASMVYPFDWTALWPLISVELGQKQTSAAIEDAHKLLAPTQQPMPATLAAIIGEAIQAWDSGQMDMANTRLQRATALAQEMGYL
jgi:serine/threonine protein kinase/tetratricopeptide (TPR) repeat protein